MELAASLHHQQLQILDIYRERGAAGRSGAAGISNSNQPIHEGAPVFIIKNILPVFLSVAAALVLLNVGKSARE